MGARVGTMIGMLVMGVAVSACSTGGPSAGAPTTAPSFVPPTASGQRSPTPSASPSPTAEFFQFPLPNATQYEVYGVGTISFSSPAIPAVNFQLVCGWSPGPGVSEWYRLSDGFSGPYSVTLAGAQVQVGLDPDGEAPDLFGIYRYPYFASYVPGPQTGTVELVDATADDASGTIRFDGLAPDPETAEPGPLPSPLADWIRPIGGDPAMATLSGTVTWLCEPAPPAVLELTANLKDQAETSRMPSPIVSEEPGPIYSDGKRPLALVIGNERRLGVTACGYYPETCGPGPGALGVESIVRIPVGGTLRFELPAECHFVRWSLEWVSQSEHERWRGLWPDTAEIVAVGETTKGPVLDLAAPPAGDWSVSLTYETDCDPPEIGRIRDLFRVVVD